jgi:hypothetical protein
MGLITTPGALAFSVYMELQEPGPENVQEIYSEKGKLLKKTPGEQRSISDRLYKGFKNGLFLASLTIPIVGPVSGGIYASGMTSSGSNTNESAALISVAVDIGIVAAGIGVGTVVSTVCAII